jgi:hypothetical protein
MAGGIERDAIAFWLGKSSLACAIGFLLVSESVVATPAQFSLRFKVTLSTHSRELPSKAGFAPLLPPKLGGAHAPPNFGGNRNLKVPQNWGI